MPSVPSKTSELENDSGFITAEEVPSQAVSHDDTMSGTGADDSPLSVNEMKGAASSGTVTIAGKEYRTVLVGGKLWMGECLKDPVGADSHYVPQKYYYSFETAKSKAPEGWHIPTDEEWTELANLVGGLSVCSVPLRVTSGWNRNQGTDVLGIGLEPNGYPGQSAEYGCWYWTASGNNFSVRCNEEKGTIAAPYMNHDTAVRFVKDSAEGKEGLVPKPSATDYDKVLSGAGEWISVAKQSDIADEAKARNEADSALAQAINDTDTEVATNKATMEENFRGVNAALALKVNEEDVYTKSEIDDMIGDVEQLLSEL